MGSTPAPSSSFTLLVFITAPIRTRTGPRRAGVLSVENMKSKLGESPCFRESRAQDVEFGVKCGLPGANLDLKIGAHGRSGYRDYRAE